MKKNGKYEPNQRVFVYACPEIEEECFAKANEWVERENQHMFVDMRSTAVCAVAEYIANEKGFTLYKCNAKYPKQKEGDN